MAAARSSWIPWAFVAAFAVVVAVNGTMVYFALSTFTGLAYDKPYDRGIAYNRIIAAEEQAARLGWTVEISWRPLEREARRGQVVVEIKDQAGGPVAGLVVEGALRRPVEALADVSLAFAPDGAGRYLAEIEAPRRGQWEARVFLDGGAERRSHAVGRVVVP
ncbi:MAG: FixH family protein [Alphaproteobacteria bacterium]|nr:FixH family protein [Alphaproteobacteria bacterium]